MRDIPTILTSQELLDKAFRRVKKVRITDIEGGKRARAEAMGKLSAISNTITATLNKYVRAFPSLDRVHPFERELIDITVGLDQLRHSLGAVDWARKTIEDIHKKELARMKSAPSKPEVMKALNSAFGRISSVLGRIDGELDFLNGARQKLKDMPGINAEEWVVVVAGCPNVGKSQLVGRISSGKPEVASYPFTTKGVSIGHLHIGYERIQVMDTPGLLDRRMESRNAIELQAIAALEHLADVLVFVFDPSEACGYPMEEQNHLLADIRERFGKVPVIEVSNKSDMGRPGPGLQVSALHDKGFDALVGEIELALRSLGDRPGIGGTDSRALRKAPNQFL